MNTAAANEYERNLGLDFTLADAYDADYLDVPEGATSAVCVECGKEFMHELSFEFDAYRHKVLTGHKLIEYRAAEVEDVDLTSAAERQTLNARMAEWFGM